MWVLVEKEDKFSKVVHYTFCYHHLNIIKFLELLMSVKYPCSCSSQKRAACKRRNAYIGAAYVARRSPVLHNCSCDLWPNPQVSSFSNNSRVYLFKDQRSGWSTAEVFIICFIQIFILFFKIFSDNKPMSRAFRREINVYETCLPKAIPCIISCEVLATFYFKINLDFGNVGVLFLHNFFIFIFLKP